MLLQQNLGNKNSLAFNRLGSVKLTWREYRFILGYYKSNKIARQSFKNAFCCKPEIRHRRRGNITTHVILYYCYHPVKWVSLGAKYWRIIMKFMFFCSGILSHPVWLLVMIVIMFRSWCRRVFPTVITAFCLWLKSSHPLLPGIISLVNISQMTFPSAGHESSHIWLKSNDRVCQP